MSSMSLNPLAEEFRPPRERSSSDQSSVLGQAINGNGKSSREQRKGSSGNGQGQRSKRPKGRVRHPNASSVRRTVYVCDIENSVTEEQLAVLFIRCGQVIDCRICGDPNSTLRFAFVEFTTEGMFFSPRHH